MKPFLKPDDDDKHVMLTFIVLIGAVFAFGYMMGAGI